MAISDAAASLFPDDPPSFLRRTPHGYHDTALVRADLQNAGYVSIEVDTVARRSIAPSARDPALAFCAGTPLRREIEARDPTRLDEAVQVATDAVAAAFGPATVDGKIQAHVVTAS